MGLAITAIVVSVVSFVYSTYQSFKAVQAQNKARREAKERAEAAKGFQFVEEGEARSVFLPFGRNKIGGTRVWFNVKTFYAYASPPVQAATNTLIPLVSKVSAGGRVNITTVGGTSYTIEKTSSNNSWDSVVVSETSFNEKLILIFKPGYSNVSNKQYDIGFSTDNSLSGPVDYGFRFDNTGVRPFWYNGTTTEYGTVISTFSTTDEFKIEYAIGTQSYGGTVQFVGNIKWYKNSTQVSTFGTSTTNAAQLQQMQQNYWSSMTGGALGLNGGNAGWTDYALKANFSAFVKMKFYSAGSKITNLTFTTQKSPCTVFFASNTPKDGPGIGWHLVNSDPTWVSGSWSLVNQPYNAATMGPEPLYVNRKETDRWMEFPKTISGNTTTYTSPKEDHIYITRRVTGYDGATPLYAETLKGNGPGAAQTFSTYGVDFPARERGGYNNLGMNDGLPTDEVSNAHEFFFLQQEIGYAGLNRIIYPFIDERPIDAPDFTFGLMLYYYPDGNIVCPLANASFTDQPIGYEGKKVSTKNGNRSTAKFSKNAYFTGVFKLNRSSPQFNGTPNVQTLVEGLKVRDVAKLSYSGTEYFGEVQEKSYSNNPARILLEYLRNEDYGMGLTEDQIDYESFYYAEKICSRVVVSNYAKSSNFWSMIAEPRHIRLFECNLTLDTANSFRDNIEKILDTMYLADLIWSGGKYKLQLTYPRIWSSSDTYETDEIVQVTDTSGLTPKLRLFRSLKNPNLNKTPLNSSNVGLDYENPTATEYWIEDVVVAEITDDDLLAGNEVQITWPSLDSKLNYASVRFLNEDLEFKEDVVHWPEREPSLYNLVYSSYGVTINTTANSKNISFTANGSPALFILPKYTILYTSTGGVIGQLAQTLAGDGSGILLENATNTTSYTNCKYIQDVVYQTYLNEDNYRKLEADFFENGITDYPHALAVAEQRVRASRATIVYSFKTNIRLFTVEPGDIVGFESTVYEIPHILLKITAVDVEEGGILTISGFEFNANILAWNVSDTSVTYPIQYYEQKSVGQASNLNITQGPTIDGTSYYTLTWTGSGDARSYLIKYTADDIPAITSTTIWQDLGSVRANTLGDYTPLEFRIPPIEGTYTLTVVVVNAKGAISEWLDLDKGTSWPLIRYTFSDRFLYSNVTFIKFFGRTVLNQVPPNEYDIITISAKLYGRDPNDEYVDNLEYRWKDITNPPGFYINVASNNNPALPSSGSGTKKYGLRSAAAVTTDAVPTIAEIGVNLPIGNAFTVDGKAIVLTNAAVKASNVFLVEIKDTITNFIYEATISVSDNDDPYTVEILCNTSNKFSNNEGSPKTFWPNIYYKGQNLSNLKGWQFRFLLNTYSGLPGGFLRKIGQIPTSYNITQNTAYDSITQEFTITLDVNITIDSDDLIKCVNTIHNKFMFFRVKTSIVNGSTVTLKHVTGIFPADTVLENMFQNGKMFICINTGGNAGELFVDGMLDNTKIDPEDFSISVHPDEIDYQSQIRVLAYKPTKHDLEVLG